MIMTNASFQETSRLIIIAIVTPEMVWTSKEIMLATKDLTMDVSLLS